MSSATNLDHIDCADPQSPSLTFSAWKLANGFGTPDAHAIYGNLGDLRIGRDMNCVKSTTNGNIACYVTNYGPAPFVNGAVNPDWLSSNNDFPGLTQGIEDAIAQHAPFATVAMVYNRNAALSQSANAVTFYVFKADETLLISPALDGEGGKTNPRMCMACHGGTYDRGTHSVKDAQFLPFDVFYFQYSSQAGYTFDNDQVQEEFRKLNALVEDTSPAPGIAEFINKTYDNAVQTPGTHPTDRNLPPPGWAGQETLYNSVYRQYCRMCHMASSKAPFLTFQDFRGAATLIEEKVCHSTDMPNAQVPYVTFWQNRIAQDDLRKFLVDAEVKELHSCK